ncbi:MAG: hypothetical protein GKR87_14180 [Kiritimatiellae bacterium]|nr:hypothetical protein [Kiritimatiellia bacterium]
MKLNAEEKEILKDIEEEKYTLRAPSKSELKEIRQAAKNTFKKDKRITIRVYQHDLNGIKKKALEQSIPYQTLISSMIHRYVEGELVEKSAT